MYICEHCQAQFNTPDVIWVEETDEYAEVCPFCNSTEFADMSDDKY